MRNISNCVRTNDQALWQRWEACAFSSSATPCQWLFDLHNAMCPETNNRPAHSLPVFSSLPFGLLVRSVLGCHLNIACYFKIRCECSLSRPSFCSPSVGRRGTLALRDSVHVRVMCCLFSAQDHTHTNAQQLHLNKPHSAAASTPLKPFSFSTRVHVHFLSARSGVPARPVCHINRWYVGD